MLLRLNAAGDVVWEKTYSADRASSGAALLAASDGGFLVVGTIQSDDGDDAGICLLRIDDEGEELWSSKAFGTPRHEFGGRLLETADGGYMIVGNSVDLDDVVADPGAAVYAGFAGRSNPYLVRTNVEGNELWSRRHETQDNVIASGGAIAGDGGIVVLSYALHYLLDDNDVRLFKLDGAGDELWSRVWEERKTSGCDLLAASDGGYLISGMQAFPEAPERAKADALLIHVDADGNELWAATYGEADMIETTHAVTETADGQYVCVG